MASRFTGKPDPSIKKNVRRARASARNAKYAHGSVVATSIAATLLAWAMFSNLEAQAIQAAQQANTAQAAITVTVPQPDAAGGEAIKTQAPSGPVTTFSLR